MKRNWKVKGFEMALLVMIVLLIVIAGFGQAVLQLWNWLMPNIFGLRPISFWQAVGLLALSWILFGGFRGGRIFARPWQHSLRERWERMTPEEREKFRVGMRGRCGQSEERAPEPKG